AVGAVASMLQLRPSDQLRAVTNLSDHHLNGSFNVARFSHTNNSIYLIFEPDHRRQLLKLLLGQTERGSNFVQTLKLGIVGRTIDPVGPAADLEKLINHRFSYPRQR